MYVVATKTEEDPVTKNMKSYITVFDIKGTVIMNDQLIGEDKFEGIEFV